MSFSELFEHLDPKVAEPISQAFDRLRKELRQEFGATERESEAAIAAAKPVAAPSEPAAGLGPDLLEELKHAVVRVDAAGTQGEILSALLEGARRFCSRSALLLVREGELAVWDAHGFAADSDRVREIRFEPAPESAWEEARGGGGAVPLSKRECAMLTDPAGGESPALGVLVPMMLARRVAALLYADRFESAPSLNLTALQLLTFAAGSVLETLPVRARESTVTLRLLPRSKPPTAPATPAPEPKPQPKPEPEPESLPEAETAETPAEPDLGPGFESPPESPAEQELSPTEVAPGREPLPESPPAGFAHEMDLSPPVDVPTIPMDAPEPKTSDTTKVEKLTTEEIPVAPPEEPATAAESQPEAPVGAPPPTEDAAPAVDGDDDDSEAVSGVGETTVVNPPTDIDGPGWAFTRTPSGSSREAQLEEARRLARLLVTEIKLYNEGPVEAGRQNNDIYNRLQEDIDRSRQIFDDRVDPEIRGDESFFDDALVRILAGGDADALGL